jgi:HEAT repeat protein
MAHGIGKPGKTQVHPEGRLSLSGLISALQDPDPLTRRRAVEELGQIGGDEAAGALVLMLKDPDDTVRALAAYALAAIGADAVEPVTRYLASWRGPIDAVVPALLGVLRSERGLDFLTAHLADPEPATRAAIASALGCIDGDRALPPLLELLRDMVDEVRIAAARALSDVQSPAAADALIDEMADENPVVRVAVVEALGRINSRKSVDVLSRASAQDSNPSVREAALAALRRVSAGVAPLIRALSGNNLSERIRAVSQLLDQGKASVLPLTELLTSDEPTVRASAAEVLGVLGDASALEALTGLLADNDDRVRLSATTALGRIKHAHSAEALARLLEDQDDKVAAAAANGLVNLGELTVHPVLGLLDHESVDVRVRAIDVLGRLRHRGACDQLVRGLTDKVIWVRVVSAQALGEIGDSCAAAALIDALRGRDPVVRATAAEALGKLHDFSATMPLLNLQSDESDLVRINALRALGRIGNPAAIPFLEQALDSPQPGVRCAAIGGLAAMRVTDVLPRLHRMSRNWPVGREPREVREAAQQAIVILEAALAQDALKMQPEESGDSRQPPAGS